MLETLDEVGMLREVCPECQCVNNVPPSKSQKQKIKTDDKKQKQIKREQIKRENIRNFQNNHLKHVAAKKEVPQVPSNRRVLCLISFLLPIIGLMVGVLMLTHRDEDDRKTGEYCIMTAVVGFVFWVVSINIASMYL